VPRTQPILLPLATALLFAPEVKAQSAQAISLQVSALYNGLAGDVFDAINRTGIGGEAQIRYTPGALSLGAGVQYTVHSLVEGSAFNEDAQLLGVFFEPRYRIYTGSNVLAPYVSARFAWLNMSFTGDDLSVDSDFIQLNAGGGLLYRLGPRFNLDMGATFGYNRLGPGTFVSTDEDVPFEEEFPASDGMNVVVRLGLAVGLGG
jgi:hypothetical protein